MSANVIKLFGVFLCSVSLISCGGGSDSSGTNSVLISGGLVKTIAGEYADKLPTASIVLNNKIIPAGGSVTIAWSSAYTSACSAAGDWSGEQLTTGIQTDAIQTVTLTKPGYYMYTLTCTGPGGTTKQSAELTVYGKTPLLENQFYMARFNLAPPNQIIGLTTTVTVPPLPAAPSTWLALAIWPGLQPGGKNYLPIGNGVLQPVLSFTPPYDKWSANVVYANTTTGSFPSSIDGVAYGPDEVGGKNPITVNPGDVLLERMELNQETGIWTQTLTNTANNESATLSMDMQGQSQNIAEFAIESGALPFDAPVRFSNTTITLASPDNGDFCSKSKGAGNAYIHTPPVLDVTKKICTIDTIIVTRN